MAGGRSEDFTPRQNEALRDALRDLRDRQGHSQATLGKLLSIKQQSAGRLLAGSGGFSYASATQLVRALGYAGVDSFFRARGVALAEPVTERRARRPARTGTSG